MNGWNTEAVKANMAKLFKLDLNNIAHAKKLERMFSGHKVTIKAELKRSVAKAYVDALAKVGAAAHFEAVDLPPSGLPERRLSQRRKSDERRTSKRAPSILRNRRKSGGRRHSDPQLAAY